MRILGKILGFIFGLMLTKHIFGALLGVWLGHRFDKALAQKFGSISPLHNEANRQATFFYTTFSVMGYIAKVDGHVSEHEIAFASAYMDKLGLNSDLRKQAQQAFTEGKQTDFSLIKHLQALTAQLQNRHDLLRLFLEIQIQAAFADGSLAQEERIALRDIATTLGFSASELEALLDMIMASAYFNGRHSQHSANGASSKQQIENAYKVLGITSDATIAQTKKAYRKLMSQHHPDKLVAKGLPPEMLEAAKQKTQDIQAAYEVITAVNKQQRE